MRSAGAWIGAALSAALFAPALVGPATVVGYDLGLFVLPAMQLAARAWREGHLPGWTPWVGHGRPYLADVSFAPLHPLVALAGVVEPVTALALGLALSFAAAWAGAWRLGRGLGLSVPAATVAAASFSLGGLQLSHVGGAVLVWSTALIPWALLACRRALAPGASPGALLLAAAPIGVDLLGAAPESAAVTGLAAFVLSRSDGVPLARSLPCLALVGALAWALAAVTFVPFAAAARDTSRAGGLPWEQASTWSLHPVELLGLVAPAVANDGPLLRVAGHVGRPWLPSCYAGAAAVGLALLAARSGWRAPRWRPLLLLGAGALLYALGRFGPLYPALWELIPPVRSLRYPAKLMAPVALVLALLAGLGLDRVRRGGATARAATWALGLLAAALAAAALAAWGPAPAQARALAHGAAAALAGAVGARRCGAGRGGGGPLLAALVTLDLAVAAHAGLVFGPRAVYEQTPALVDSVRRVEALDGSPARVATLRSAFDARIDAPGLALAPEALLQLGWREALLPNAGAEHRVRSAVGFSSFGSRRALLLGQALDDREASAVDQARALGARLAVAREGTPDAAGLEPVASAGPYRLGRVPRAAPWLALVPAAARVSTTEEAVERVTAPGFDARAGCVVEDPLGLLGPAPPTGSGRAALVAFEDERLEVEVHADGPALLVVREAWATGWSAAVEGEPAPLLAVDVLFRGVPVGPGRSRVVLRYEAAGRSLGAAISAAAWLAVAVAALAPLRRGRRR